MGARNAFKACVGEYANSLNRSISRALRTLSVLADRVSKIWNEASPPSDRQWLPTPQPVPRTEVIGRPVYRQRLDRAQIEAVGQGRDPDPHEPLPSPVKHRHQVRPAGPYQAWNEAPLGH